MSHPIVAVADLHGHLHLFDALLDTLERQYGMDYTLVTLGDYVDKGPQIPELLDRLVALKAERGDRFLPVMGNHDLACLRAIGWEGGAPDDAWGDRWFANYVGDSTARAYGVSTPRALASVMPTAHRDFLQALPWFHLIGDHVFVHAGLEEGPVAPQLAALSRRELLSNGYTQPQLRDTVLAGVSDPSWGHVVVSAHTWRPGRPHVVTDHRITLSSESDYSQHLWAVILPERRFLCVDPAGRVTAPLADAAAPSRAWPG